MDYYYCVKVVFVVKHVSAMVFGGGILGGARKIWGNPYLNSMTVLFDKQEFDKYVCTGIMH